MKKRNKRKIKTTVHAGINIREVRPDYFLVDCQRGLNRERKCFKDLAEAKTYCDILATKIRNEGTDALGLPSDSRADATKALEILDGKTSLVAAARFWRRHNAVADGMTVSDLGDKWFAALRRSGCRETTMREREHKVGRLAAAFGDRPAAGIMSDDLVQLMDTLHVTGVTADGYRRCWHALYTFAISEGIAEVNPVAKIKPFKSDEKLPKPFAVKDVRSILATAAEYAPALVPTLAVQFFGGLRPGEALGLTWENIDLDEKTIRVLPEVSKMRRSRIVDINDTLAAWLRRYRKKSGPIGIVTHGQFAHFMHRKPIGPEYQQTGIPKAERQTDDRPKGLLAAAGINWIQDGPRKSFASYHYATYQDQARLQTTLGHTGDPYVLYNHYRGLVTKKAAAEYWKIRPAAMKGKVIQLVQSA